MNDAGNFILMDRIGPGTAYDMPRGTVLLADKGYGDFVPLLTPFRLHKSDECQCISSDGPVNLIGNSHSAA